MHHSAYYAKYAKADEIQAPHTWIIMNYSNSKSYHVYFHWYHVFNFRNENVTEGKLIVNMLFKWH